MAQDLQKQRFISPEDAGAVGLSDQVFHIVGEETITVARPGTDEKPTLKSRMLVVICERGSFRFRIGEVGSAGIPEGDFPTVTDTIIGDGSVLLVEGRDLVLPAPISFTARGNSPDSVFTYFWV